MRWRTAAPAPAGLTTRLEPLLLAVSAGRPLDDCWRLEWLRQYPRRLVFRVQAPVAAVPSCVVKACRIRDWRTLRHFRRYGRQEFANLQAARDRGVPVGQAYALAEHWRLVPRLCAVVLEDLAPLASLGSWLEQGALRPADLPAILSYVTPLFRSLYSTGVNHIDVTASNVMVDGALQVPPRLIDLQYATFLSGPSEKAMLLQAVRFAQSLASWTGPEAFHGWLGELLPGWAGRWEVFLALYPLRLSRDERLRLRLP